MELLSKKSILGQQLYNLLADDWLTLYAEVERLSEIEARMNLKIEQLEKTIIEIEKAIIRSKWREK